MSQLFYIIPSFNFMKFIKNNHEKITKIFPFFDIKLKLGPVSQF